MDKARLRTIGNAFAAALSHTATVHNVDTLRISYLGRKGALAAVFGSLKNLPSEERKKVGEEANRLREEIERLLADKKAALEKTSRESILKKERLDVTRPGIKSLRGHLHPITKIRREIEDIFRSMGFGVAEGPEVETEHYNFDSLNLPETHPAREMQDTWWIARKTRACPETLFRSERAEFRASRGRTTQAYLAKVRQGGRTKAQPKLCACGRIKGFRTCSNERLLLRTQVTAIQVRFMEKNNPPFRIIMPGAVYRRESTDASHETQFTQMDGLIVDKKASLADLKGIMRTVLQRIFGSDIKTRLRAGYFPFVEPGVEMDIECLYCKQKGCSVCKRSGWIEVFPGGVVHPHVFKTAGYNPKEWQGIAWDIGVDRIAILKYKIPDVRLLRSGDLRFLKQF